jgi:Peptidase family M50
LHFVLLTSWVFLALLVAFAALHVGLFVHECGHAIVARMLGMRVLEVQLGAGRPIWSFRGGETAWALRFWPRHGSVLFAATSARWFRVRMIAILLAGPMASTALAICGWVLCRSQLSQMLPVSKAQVLLRSAAITWVAIAVFAWLPVRWRSLQGRASDVLKVLQLLRSDAAQVQAQLDGHAAFLAETEAWRAFEAGTPDVALAILDRAAADIGLDSFVMRPLCTWARDGARAALACQDEQEARAQRWLAGAGLSPEQAAVVHDGLQLVFQVNRAFYCVQTGDPALLPEADRCTRLAMAAEPENVACLRTRGLVQLHLGAVNTGMALLEHAWRGGEGRCMRALCALYLAFGHALEGHAAKAHRFLRRARNLHRESPLLARYTELVAAELARPGGMARSTSMSQSAPPSASTSGRPPTTLP